MMANDDLLKHILLDLISTARPVAETRLSTLSDADWQALCTIAREHRIGPMLHHRLQVLELSTIVPANIVDQWAKAYRKAAFRYLSFRKTLARLNEILNAADIPFAALKGAWLSQYAYANPVLRPSRDIDILVEPELALAVYALLEKNGFVRHKDFPMPLGGAIDHHKHLPPMRHTETGIDLDVHTRLMGVHSGPTPRGALDDIPLLLARCENREGVPYLSPTDTLLHLIVHAAYDHQFNNGPLTFNDIAFLLDRATVDWQEFWKMAEAGGWVRGCIMILELASFYHKSVAWRANYHGPVPVPLTHQLESAALLSLQDYDHRGLVGFKAAIADDIGWYSKAGRFLDRVFPPLHRLAAFSGASTASYWSLLHYPRWLVVQIQRLVFTKVGAGMMHDVDRAKDVRSWMYDDNSSVSTSRPHNS